MDTDVIRSTKLNPHGVRYFIQSVVYDLHFAFPALSCSSCKQFPGQSSIGLLHCILV